MSGVVDKGAKLQPGFRLEDLQRALRLVPPASRSVAYVGPRELAELSALRAEKGALGITDLVGMPVVLVPGFEGVSIVPEPPSLRAWRAWEPTLDLAWLCEDPPPVAWRARVAALLLAVPLVVWGTLLAFHVLLAALGLLGVLPR